MARIVIDRSRLNLAFLGDGIRQALEHTAGTVQDEAVRITYAEAVDTGLMAASWRIRPLLRGGWVVRVINTARSPAPERAPYPYFQNFGWRTRSGRHIPGKHILERSIDAARR